MKTRLDHCSRNKKALLIFGAVCIVILVARFSYLLTRPAESEVVPVEQPDYNKLMQEAIKNLESAQSALIYKDYNKAGRLLDQAQKSARQVLPSPELKTEALELISQIKEEQQTAREQKEEAEKAQQGL